MVVQPLVGLPDLARRARYPRASGIRPHAFMHVSSSIACFLPITSIPSTAILALPLSLYSLPLDMHTYTHARVYRYIYHLNTIDCALCLEKLTHRARDLNIYLLFFFFTFSLSYFYPNRILDH